MSDDPFARLALLMVRARWIVLIAWIVLIVGSVVLLSPKASQVVKGGGFTVPNSPAARAETQVKHTFGGSTQQAALVVFHSGSLTVDSPKFRADVRAAAQALRTMRGVARVTSYYSAGDPSLVSKDRHTTVVSATLLGSEADRKKTVTAIRKKLVHISLSHHVTGAAAVGADTLSTSEEDLKRSEFITIPLVLLLLLVVFRTVVSSALPIVLGLSSVTLTEALIYLVGSHFDVSVFALNVASMIGLGLGIDFSLIVVSRLREEVASLGDTTQAIAVTMATAGRSITYSGITVMLSMSLLSLMLNNLMVVRSISMAIVMVAFTALFAALTLLPALLSILGPRIEWLRVIPASKSTQPEQSGFWYKLSDAIMKHPWVWLIACLIVLGAVASPVRNIGVVGATVGNLPASTDSVEGAHWMESAFGKGSLSPIEVVVKTGPGGIFTPPVLSAIQTLTDRSAANPRGRTVDSLWTVAQSAHVKPARFPHLTAAFFLSGPRLTRGAAAVSNIRGAKDVALVKIISPYGAYTSAHQQFVSNLRHTVIPSIAGFKHVSVNVGGEAADFSDFRDSLYNRFPYVVAAVMLLIFIILMMFFQSVFIPLKAILMNLITTVATYGALVLIFQNGFGSSLLGFTSQGLISVITPAILYVILFSLSTDYEVFMLSRVREYYHETHDNQKAVSLGLQSTAGIITAAGLILMGTFGSFASANVVAVKEIGLGLAIGVFFDTSIVRVIMVPASMRLMGDWNWWMPRWLARIVPELREGPSPQMAAAFASPGLPRAAATGPSTGLPLQVQSDRPGAVIGHLHPRGGSIGADDIILPRYRPLRIGSDDSMELQLFSPTISPQHARIDYKNGRYMVTDLGSRYGVFVNGLQIPQYQPYPLRDGDVLQVSKEGPLRFIFDSEPVGTTLTSPAAR